MERGERDYVGDEINIGRWDLLVLLAVCVSSSGRYWKALA